MYQYYGRIDDKRKKNMPVEWKVIDGNLIASPPVNLRSVAAKDARKMMELGCRDIHRVVDGRLR